ncbi:MAG: Ig-like domain-containing protein [Lachnospiraceae bacterium]|nr:Ig-like domain-containing protein [Lachnospiraceae bacterium]
MDMKKIVFTVFMISALLGCQKGIDNEMPVGNIQDFEAVTEDFSALSKTGMDELRNVIWSEGDLLAIFQGCTMADKYQVSDASVGKSNGTFKIVSDDSSDINGDFSSGGEIATNIAVYPYSDDLSCTNAVVTDGDSGTSVSAYSVNGFVLPEVQAYSKNSFGDDTFPMVAVTTDLSDHSLKFKNVCGGMKLQLKGTQKVVSIKLEGKNNEKLSGAVTLTAYPGDLSPAITMSSGASTSVTLDCSDGVQLSESTATDFIISLPPVLFSKGFTVTVTDSDNKTYTVETDRANTVLRSSILVMPSVMLKESGGEPEEDEGGELVIPVETITLSNTSSELYPTQTQTIEITAYRPIDATDVTFTWTSDTPTVATVDQTGKITAVSAGKAKITVVSGSGKATCTVTVIKWPDPAVATVEYVDEYGINHGYGVVIGGQCWAPVNCGYHAEDFPYGKLYQWGRKYGQGLGASYDKGTVTMTDGGVSLIGGQHSSNADKFFTGPSDWLATKDDKLWNTGTESTPKKSECDPCPEGWRVPVKSELTELAKNHSDFVTLTDGQKGMYFSGVYEYSEDASKIFLPASGYRNYSDGDLSDVGNYGYYWSVTPYGIFAYYLYFYGNGYVYSSYSHYRAYGRSVRCLQE